jgi:hypothetical protein
VVKLLGKTLTTEAQRDRTENHREDLLMLVDAFFSNLLEFSNSIPGLQRGNRGPSGITSLRSEVPLIQD